MKYAIFLAIILLALFAGCVDKGSSGGGTATGVDELTAEDGAAALNEEVTDLEGDINEIDDLLADLGDESFADTGISKEDFN